MTLILTISALALAAFGLAAQASAMNAVRVPVRVRKQHNKR